MRQGIVLGQNFQLQPSPVIHVTNSAKPNAIETIWEEGLAVQTGQLTISLNKYQLGAFETGRIYSLDAEPVQQIQTFGEYAKANQVWNVLGPPQLEGSLDYPDGLQSQDFMSYVLEVKYGGRIYQAKASSKSSASAWFDKFTLQGTTSTRVLLVSEYRLSVLWKTTFVLRSK